jgi:hypothetical protein
MAGRLASSLYQSGICVACAECSSRECQAQQFVLSIGRLTIRASTLGDAAVLHLRGVLICFRRRARHRSDYLPWTTPTTHIGIRSLITRVMSFMGLMHLDRNTTSTTIRTTTLVYILSYTTYILPAVHSTCPLPASSHMPCMCHTHTCPQLPLYYIINVDFVAPPSTYQLQLRMR